MATSWAKQMQIKKQDPSLDKLSFSEAVDQAVKRLAPQLIDDLADYCNAKEAVNGIEPQLPDTLRELTPERYLEYHLKIACRFSSGELKAKLRSEFRQYFETGNCGQSSTTRTKVNPTFIHPATGRWFVHYAACPLDGFFPLPMNELENQKDNKFGVAFGYCRVELKKLLKSFINGKERIKFFFHLSDALSFCYQDSPLKFDIVDTSNLADHVGLANILNAAARKLDSDKSLLITESLQWVKVAPDVAQYLQEVLCCPHSLIPTIYGLRLLNIVQLGSEKLHSIRFLNGASSRLRWKKSLPFEKMPLILSLDLVGSLERLKKLCFLSPSAPDRCGMDLYSPLTFHYILSDMVQRVGFPDPPALVADAISGLPPTFRKSLETIKAWMEHRPVWRVKVVVPFSLFGSQVVPPVLRLVLVPARDFAATLGVSKGLGKLFDQTSTKNHFIDNFDLSLKLKTGGGIEWIEMSFLLKDRGLLESHGGIIVDVANGLPIFAIGLFSSRPHQVDPFDQRYPWVWRKKSNELAQVSSGQSRLIVDSCTEMEAFYIIRFKLLSGRKEVNPSGIKQLFFIE